jgi:hypothetical protein
MWKDGQTDVTKLIVAFNNFSIALKTFCSTHAKTADIPRSLGLVFTLSQDGQVGSNTRLSSAELMLVHVILGLHMFVSGQRQSHLISKEPYLIPYEEPYRKLIWVIHYNIKLQLWKKRHEDLIWIQVVYDKVRWQISVNTSCYPYSRQGFSNKLVPAYQETRRHISKEGSFITNLWISKTQRNFRPAVNFVHLQDTHLCLFDWLAWLVWFSPWHVAESLRN